MFVKERPVSHLPNFKFPSSGPVYDINREHKYAEIKENIVELKNLTGKSLNSLLTIITNHE